jgi:hypothetical protein
MRSWMVCTPYPISCGDKIEKIEMCGPCSTYGEGRGVYRVLLVKPEEKRPLGDPGVVARIMLR